MVLEKTQRIAVQPDGSVRESLTLRVRLEEAAELAAWSPFPILLDENRSLEDITTYAVKPDGERLVVKPKEHDEAEVAASGELHSSRRLRRVEFPPLPAGSELVIAYTVREDPYFPSGTIRLGENAPVAALRVEISSAPALAWKIDEDTRVWDSEALEVEEGPGWLRLVGEGLPAVNAPELAPGDAGRGPLLRYSWGGVTWPEVGRWCREMLTPASGIAPQVVERVRSLTAGAGDGRQRLETLLDFACRRLRYVAVEVGAGGFRPTPPGETLARGWGDCKDKSVLLVEMLRQAGIEAYPVLVLSTPDQRIDPTFATPFQFNHAIVAVPAEGLVLEGEDPVSEGYLFLDPSHERGTSRWLHPGVQDQLALVIRDDATPLVATPRLFHRNRRALSVELQLDEKGDAHGTVELVLTGSWGAAFTEGIAGERTDRVEEAARSVLAAVLPGAELSRPNWGEDLAAGAPRVLLRAVVEVAGLVTGGVERRSLRLAGLETVPPPSLLDERSLPVLLSPGVTRERWRFHLPQGYCPPQNETLGVANEVGSFRQSVGGTAGELVVERQVEIGERWVEPQSFGALAELGLADTRARKRRVRFVLCTPAVAGAVSAADKRRRSGAL